VDEELHIVYLSGHAVRCRVRRRLRTGGFRLIVRSDGILVVSIPRRLAHEEVRRLVREHEQWILRRLSLLRERHLARPPFKLQEGAVLPLWDRRYWLHLERVPGASPQWKCSDQTVVVTASELSGPIVCGCVVGWYKTMARRQLRIRVAHWAEKMGLAPKRLAIKNQHTVWGSCSRRGNLNLNWRIMLLEQEVADYLLVHELAHLREPNHSARFWALVGKFCPDYRRLRRELASFHHWLGFPEALFIEC